MAHLACPCGNSLWNGFDGDETEYYFVDDEVLKSHQEDLAFFEVMYNGMSIEMWKCDICDRMMVFDDPCGPVSRYMRRIDAKSIPNKELAKPHAEGICFNNLLFNEVDRHLGYDKRFKNGDYELFGTKGEQDGGPLFTTKLATEEIFSHKNGRFRNWWYASLYEDCLVFYSPLMDRKETPRPVKAWRRYDQMWSEE